MPALGMAGPAVLIVFVAAFGLHGDSTLTFRELGGLYIGEPGLRLVVLILWALVMAPAVRLAIFSEGLTYLRWLALPRSLILTHLLGLLALLNVLPVVPLFVAGMPAEGIGMWLALVGISACLLPGARSVGEHGLRLAAAAGLVAAVGLGYWMLAIGLGLGVAALRIPRVWRLAPEHSHWRSSTRWIFGGPLLALASAQVLHIWRREAAALSRVLLISALGVFLIQLIAKANYGYVSEGALVVASTPAIAAVSIMLASVLKRARKQLTWVVRTLGISLSRERAVSLAIIAFGGGALAATMAFLVHASTAHIAALAVHTAAWALLALGISSRSQEEVRSASIALAMAVFAMFTIGLGGRSMLGIELFLGLGIAGRMLLREVPDA